MHVSTPRTSLTRVSTLVLWLLVRKMSPFPDASFDLALMLSLCTMYLCT